MTKLLAVILASIAMANLAWAENNSLSQAAIDISARGAPPTQANQQLAVPYSNADEQHNSLSRAALAKQGTKTVYLRFDSGSPVLYRKPVAAQIISPSAYSFWNRIY